MNFGFIIDISYGEILSVIDKLPFAAFVSSILDTLHVKILSVVDKLDLKVGFIINDSNLAVQFLLFTYAIYRFWINKAQKRQTICIQ